MAEEREESIADATLASWPVGTVVSISRLPGLNTPMAKALGIGQLLDVPNPGTKIRIRVDHGRALSPSTILSVEQRAPNVLRLETTNHRYELTQIEGTTSRAGVVSIHDELSTGPSSGSDDSLDRTRIVQVNDWPDALSGRLESGARVSVTQVRDGSLRDLGVGILLVDLRVGDVAAFSLEEGIVGTSEVLEIRDRGKSRVELLTKNSTYKVGLIEGGGSSR